MIYVRVSSFAEHTVPDWYASLALPLTPNHDNVLEGVDAVDQVKRVLVVKVVANDDLGKGVQNCKCFPLFQIVFQSIIEAIYSQWAAATAVVVAESHSDRVGVLVEALHSHSIETAVVLVFVVVDTAVSVNLQ